MKWAIVANSFKCGQNDIKTKWYQTILHPNLPPYHNDPLPNTVLLWVCREMVMLPKWVLNVLSSSMPAMPPRTWGSWKIRGISSERQSQRALFLSCEYKAPFALNSSSLLLYSLFSVFVSSLRSTALFVFLNTFFLLKSIFWIVIYIPGIKS